MALVVVLGLVLIPPLFAARLDAWRAALELLPAEPRLVEHCGPKLQVTLSRWFYTYKFSGDNAQATFRGRVVSSKCNRPFTVELDRKNKVWTVKDVSP